MGLLGSILKSVAARKLRENTRKAEAGDPRAQLWLGRAYCYGSNVVPQNDAEAVKWLRKAAEQGHSDAQIRLGTLLADGRGAGQDLTEAYKWICLADHGFRFGEPLSDSILIGLKRDTASQCLNRVRALMTDDQIAEALKRTNQFVEARDDWCRLPKTD